MSADNAGFMQEHSLFPRGPQPVSPPKEMLQGGVRLRSAPHCLCARPTLPSPVTITGIDTSLQLECSKGDAPHGVSERDSRSRC